MAVQTYLIHFRDRQLALAVGAGLERRLVGDGREAVALVPAGDSLGLTRAEGGGQRVGRAGYGGTPHVVALHEEGLLDTLEFLGVTAYVGVWPGAKPTAVRWAGGGAILLPVATARHLIDAVADHTPWAVHAARLADADSGWGREASRGSTPGPALSRKLVVAGIAGPLLLAGLPAAASVSAAPANRPSAKTGVAARLAAKMSPQLVTTQVPVPANEQAFLREIENALRYYLQQTGQATATNNQATQALAAQIMRLVNAFINSQPRAAMQPGQAAHPGQAAQPTAGGQGAGGAPTNAGSQGQGQQAQQAAQQGQGQQGQGQQGQGQQDPSTSQDPSASQGSSSSPGSSTSQGTGSGMGATSSGAGTSSQGSGASGGGGSSSSGGGASSGGGGSSSGGGASSGGGSG